MVGLPIPPNLRTIRFGRWLVLLFCVAFLLISVETFLFQGDSRSARRWKGWTTPHEVETQPQRLQYDDKAEPIRHEVLDSFQRETILPYATGRVVVTGGGGMIGKRVVRRLLQAGIPVTVLDVIFYEEEEDAIKKDHPRGDLRIVRGDLRDPEALATAMEEASGVIHLAAVSRVLWCLENLEDCTDINVRGTELVLNALQSGWFIQASSREVYGNHDELPVAEDATRTPANVYGKSKAEAEDVITSHVEKVAEEGSKHINAIMLRLSNVYGSTKDHPERLIPAIVRNAVSNRPIQMVGGDQDLDMVFVEDVVDAMSLAVSRLHAKTNRWIGKSKGTVEVFNVGTSSSTSAMSLIQKTLWLTNSSSPLRIIPGDDRFPSRYVGSTVKASEELGYKARVSIDEGLYRLATNTLRETIGYLRDKRNAEPFRCQRPKEYSVNDLLFLDGCRGIISVRGGNNDTLYGNFMPANPDRGWNNTNHFVDTEQPTPWTFDISHSPEYDDRDIRIALHAVIDKNGTEFAFGIPPPGGGDATQYEFLARLDPSTGYINLRKMNGEPVELEHRAKRSRVAPRDVDAEASSMTSEAELEYNFRITPTCCNGKPAPWPFFRDDSLAANILDSRSSRVHPFEASQIKFMCSQMREAQDYAIRRVETLEGFSRPIVLQEAPLPIGRAPDWRMRRYTETCRNLCDHPTFCVDTGSCMCVHAAQCVPKTRFPWSAVANREVLSYPPLPEEDNTGKDDALVNRLARSSWPNILDQNARRYFTSKPVWPPLHAAKDPDEIEKLKENRKEQFWKLRNSAWGCFSADTAMELAARQISKNYRVDNSLVFIPFYSLNDFIKEKDGPGFYPDTRPFYDNAMKQLMLQDRKEIEPNDVVMTFSHDFGRCNKGILNVLDARRGYVQPAERHRRLTSWAPMGDLNSQCFYPDQDVIIPSRTCLQDSLYESFQDVSKIKPARRRSVLVTFKGRTNIWAGSIVRNKLACDRPLSPGKLTGGDKLEVYWQTYKPWHNYIQMVNETIFCVLPRGTTGWATRTIDVAYGGCIPVLIGQETQHIFWDVLDWSKFAVFVNEWDLERLEDILLSYTWEQVEQMQANLVLVRDAFIYPSVGKEKEALQERSPFWYAMHSTWLRKLTRFPT